MNITWRKDTHNDEGIVADQVVGLLLEENVENIEFWKQERISIRLIC